MDIFWEVHRDLPREGPGDDASTARAFSLLDGLPDSPTVLDIGCGPGMQSRQLARLSPARITAIDVTWHFLRDLQRSVEPDGQGGGALAGRIQPVCMSMFDLGFPPETFDLIWSEGAIYIRGFDEGLRACLPLLKPGGCMAVTELTWLRPDPPAPAAEFWRAGYPPMRSRAENEAAARAIGFNLLGSFVLPERAWTEQYYDPMQRRITMLREKYAAQPEALKMLDAADEEIAIYRQYHRWYGYVFYILRRK
jgi:SAM-dependent methyltransferase